MRLFYVVVFIAFAAAEFCIIMRLKRRNQKTGMQATTVSFGLFFLLTLAVWLFDLEISRLVMLLVLVALFLDAYVGYDLNVYEKSRVADRYLHGYGTFALALLVYNILIILTEEGGSKLFRSLFVLFLGIALGAIYEIIEFVTDLRQNSKMQKGLKDTNLDIIFNIVGSILAAAASFFFML